MACTTSTAARHQNVQLLSRIFKLKGKRSCSERSANFVFYGWELRQPKLFVPGDDKRDANTNQSWLPAVWALWASSLVSLQTPSSVWKCCSGLLCSMEREGDASRGSVILLPSSHPTPPLELGSSPSTSCASEVEPIQCLLLRLYLAFAGSQITGCPCCNAVHWEAPGRKKVYMDPCGVSIGCPLYMGCYVTEKWLGQVMSSLWRDALEVGSLGGIALWSRLSLHLLWRHVEEGKHPVKLH